MESVVVPDSHNPYTRPSMSLPSDPTASTRQRDLTSAPSPSLRSFTFPPQGQPARRTVSHGMVGDRKRLEEAGRRVNDDPAGESRGSTPNLEESLSSEESTTASSSGDDAPTLIISPALEDFIHHQNRSSKLKKRPSALLLDSVAYSHTLDNSSSVSSPNPPVTRMRRSYPFDPSTSPLPSPLQSDFETFSPGLQYLSPNLPSSSSDWSTPSSPSLLPTSPRLADFVDPFARLAKRLSPSNGSSTDLPVTTRVDSSGRLSPKISLSPILGTARKSSFAAKSKEAEKEAERKQRTEHDVQWSTHNRKHSWTEKIESSRRSNRKGWAKVLLIIIGLGLMGWIASTLTISGVGHSKRWSRLYRVQDRTRSSTRRGLRRKTIGVDFIHPDVINPYHRRPSRLSTVMALLSLQHISRQFSYRSDQPSLSPSPTFAPRRFYHLPPVAFTHHHPLPPPPVHNDAPERDTIILYRILGNDLPPRHSPGQLLRNLRFLLQHESDFSTLPHLGPHLTHHAQAYGSGSKGKTIESVDGGLRVDKYFVVNRIVDPQVLDAILAILRLYSVPESRILIIPFDYDEYEKRGFRWSGGIENFTGWGIGNEQSIKVENVTSIVENDAGWSDSTAMKENKQAISRFRALDYVYHEKNSYVMNNNGGRNFALEHGRSLPNARWLLPLDGNTFLTPAAMNAIVSTLSVSGEGSRAARYVILPMNRLLSNDDVIANNSISLLPKHHSDSTTIDATAPISLDEPQIGFRYDATESYEPAMRYGRRSKLELLWRLGAIPHSQGLDRRTLPWESDHRGHIASNTWGSIPGVVDSGSVVGRTEGDESSPVRGPLAFVRAGWVYRLFSGDKTQEEFTPEAMMLRKTNRIKGIIAFLEQLDDRVARGKVNCVGGECGFSREKLWTFSSDGIERLRQQYRLEFPEARARVAPFLDYVLNLVPTIDSALLEPTQLGLVNAESAATHAFELALAGRLTSNSSLSTLAADLINARFISPMALHSTDQRKQLQSYLHLRAPPPKRFVGAEHVAGYAFPPPPPSTSTSWSNDEKREEEVSLPFNPMSFDPTLLVDAIRILALSDSANAAVSRHSIEKLAHAQLSYLLFSPDALALSQNPPTLEAGVTYDRMIITLAAFLDDARLIGRVVNRARLRLSRSKGIKDGILGDERYLDVVRGLKNIRFRPFQTVSISARRKKEGKTPLEKLGEI